MGKIYVKNPETCVRFNKMLNKTTCRICKKVLYSNAIGVIRKHCRIVHNIRISTHHMRNKKPTETRRKPPIADGTNCITHTPPTTALETSLDKSEFLKCCLGMVTIKSLPFKIFDDRRYFKKLIQPYEKKYHLDLNSKTIIETLKTCALQIQTAIKAKVWNAPINVMVDMAISNKKIIIIISAQYLEDFKIISQTLGTMQFSLATIIIYPSLKNRILHFFQNFQINFQQIQTITIDYRLAHNKHYRDDGLPKEDLEILEKLNNFPRKYGLIKEELYKELELATFTTLNPIYLVKSSADNCIILLGQAFFKCYSRVESNQVEYKIRMGLDLPSTYFNSSEWISTFYKFNELKYQLTESNLRHDPDWKCVTNFVEAFTPLIDFEKQLHNEQYVCGDFYRDWLVCEAKLKQMQQNDYAAKLLESMMQEKLKLLDNDAFMSALYFDPRFNYFDTPYFTVEQRQKTVEHILKIHTTLNSIRDKIKDTITTDLKNEPSDKDLDDDKINDPYQILEQELQTLSGTTTQSRNTLNVQQKLENLSNNIRQPFARNILEYWKHLPDKDADIYNILQIVLALPTSQVNVDKVSRAISSIPIEQRPTLTNEMLNNILIVKLNEDLIECGTICYIVS